jgi:hypothetical protein
MKYCNGDFDCSFHKACGPGSAVGTATGYGLDSPGIESRWGGEIFRTCPDRPWSPPSLLYNGYRVFTRGKGWPGRDADLSPPSTSALGHERVELYLYSPYGPHDLKRASVPVQGALYFFPKTSQFPYKSDNSNVHA